MSPPSSLRKSEARQRADLIDVTRYHVSLDFTGLLEGAELRTTSRITFTATPGSETFVDCQAGVDAAVLNGSPLPAGAVEGDRIRLTGLTEHNELVVDSVQTETASALGVHRSVDPVDGEVYVWTTFEPDEARRVFACFDQPDLKAVFAITARLPGRWIATSNSGDAEVSVDGSHRIWAFPDTPPLSTYNIVCNAGPFHELRSQRGGYDLGLLARRSLSTVLERDAGDLFRTTAAGLAFYGEQFALPFPQRRYDQVFVPDFGAGAMENFGCVTWIDTFLYRSEPTAAERERRTRVLLHEMAHMWFGDMVTMRWWDDLWLNESFAEWACHWAAERVTEFADVWAADAVNDKQRAYAADLAPTTHPIQRAIVDVEATRSTVDAITYAKGASTLKQLVHLVGEDAFVAALRGYFAAHAWGNATLADLVAAVEQAAGRDLAPWVAGWLGTAGTDEIGCERTGTDVELSLIAPAGREPLVHRLDVGVYVADDEGLRLDRTHDVELSDRVLLRDVPEDALVLLNDNDHTFAAVRPDPVSLAAMVAGAGLLPTPVGRAVAVTTAWGLLMRGELAADALVGAALDVLRHEAGGSVVEPVSLLARHTADQWAVPERRVALTTQVADVAFTLVDHPEQGAAAARTFASTATTDEQLAALDGLVSTSPADLSLGWRRLARRGRLGLLDLEEVVALEARDPDPEAWVSSLGVRVHRPSRAAKLEGLDAVLTEPTRLGFRGIRAVAEGLWLPGQEDELAGLPDQWLGELGGLARMGSKFAGFVVASLFPTVAVDDAFLDRALAAAARDDVLDVVGNRVRERGDTVGRMLRARTTG